MKFNTKCVHGSGKPDSTGAISPAIYMSSTFTHPGLGETTGFQYTRESNPTRDRLRGWLLLMQYSICFPLETMLF